MHETFKESAPTARSPEERVLRNREVVKKAVAVASKYAAELSWIQNFEGTTRDRGLFIKNSKDSLVQPLAMSLFHIDPEEKFGELEEKIDGKNILLIGGGRSMEDLTSTRRLSPKTILNVDPYLNEDAPNRKLCPQYKHVKLDATVHDMPQQVRELGYDKFEEIWCIYSIPQYCKSESEAVESLLNLEELLAVGGTIRINPLVFFALNSVIEVDRKKYFQEVSAGFLKGLNQLAAKKDIEMSMFRDRAYPEAPFYTLLIHKLKS